MRYEFGLSGPQNGQDKSVSAPKRRYLFRAWGEVNCVRSRVSVSESGRRRERRVKRRSVDVEKREEVRAKIFVVGACGFVGRLRAKKSTVERKRMFSAREL